MPGPFIWLGPDGHRYEVSVEPWSGEGDEPIQIVIFNDLDTRRVRTAQVGAGASLRTLLRGELEALLKAAR